MQSDNVYLYGYYGMKNLGDNALLLATAWGAQNYLGANHFIINTPEPLNIHHFGHFPKTIAKQQRFPGQNRFLQYRSAFKSQQVIFGGGSVLHCSRDINLMRGLMKLSGRGPHRAIGVGLGPFKNSKAEQACKKFLNECDFVGVRDKESYQIAESLAPNSEISLTFDLAPLLLDIPNARDPLDKIYHRGIGVALCPKERLQGNANAELCRLQAIAKSLADCHRETGEPIYLIDLNGHPELGDSKVHDELQSLMASDIPVFRIAYNPNPLLLMARLGLMRAVIGMRLHASVLAYLSDSPVISLNYHSKCDGWCDQIGMPQDYRLDAFDIDANHLTALLVDGLQNNFLTTTLKPHMALKEAKNNFLPLEQSVGAALC